MTEFSKSGVSQITKAVESMVESWDIETLVNFAIEERLDYYLGKNVSQEEIELLIKETQQ